ncbi:MAG: hypothetical protein A2103_01960 [Gammaproteobacteria bacterium GWF2_41_13]|nr:MAG: hypothetical protein A2103_01960 [Gammaproteobacteria bacterium GWF2_41_13]
MLKLLLVWPILTFFLLLAVFSQVCGNLFVNNLLYQHHLSLTQVGLLNSAFFWGYLLMQLPAGYWLNRYGRGYLLFIAAIGLGVGSFLFVLAPSAAISFIGRLLMGLSAAFAFVGLVINLGHCIKKESLHFAIGLSSMTCLLAMAALQHQLPPVIEQYGWQFVMERFAWVSIFAGVLIALIFPLLQARSSEKEEPILPLFQSIAQAMTDATVLKLGALAFCFFSIFTVFVDLWGSLFLQKVHNFDQQSATRLIAWVLLGMAFGGPILGVSHRFLQRPLWLLKGGTLVALVLMLMLIFAQDVRLYEMIGLLFMLGLCCSLNLLIYTVANQWPAENIRGVAVAFCNMMTAFAAIVFQPLMGFALMRWQPMQGQLEFQLIFLAFPIMLLAAFFII